MSVYRSAFSSPIFRIYFPSSCLATLGSWVVRFLLGWLAWTLSQSAFFVGCVACALLVPTFILSPWFGVLADRINTRTGLLTTTALQGIVATMAALVTYLDLMNQSLLLAFALCFGSIIAAHTPIRLAFIPFLVERNALPSAIGLSAVAFNTSRIIGPAAGAALLATTSIAATFLMGAFLTIVAHALLWRVRVDTRLSGDQNSAGSFWVQLVAAFTYLLEAANIRWIFFLTMVSGLLGRSALELLPAISGAILDGGASTLALLTAMAGVGSVIGGLLVSRQASRLDRIYDIVRVALGIAALTLLTLALWNNTLWAGAGVCLVSCCTTIVGTGCQSLVQLMVAVNFRGRVMSLWTVVGMGTPAIGALIAGTAADHFGFPLVLAFPAVGAVVVLVLSAQIRRSFRLGNN
ncbi:MAG: MFS transporter [Pseudomonadota bacterium]